jgi:hypothetical protein
VDLPRSSELRLAFIRRVALRGSTPSSRYDTNKRSQSLLVGECLFACCTSGIGPLRHFAATQQFGRFRSEADIQRAALTARIYEYAT